MELAVNKIRLDKRHKFGPYIVSRDRYDDGVDWAYFETFTEVPENVLDKLGGSLYHKWESNNNGPDLIAYLIPLENVDFFEFKIKD